MSFPQCGRGTFSGTFDSMVRLSSARMALPLRLPCNPHDVGRAQSEGAAEGLDGVSSLARDRGMRAVLAAAEEAELEQLSNEVVPEPANRRVHRPERALNLDN